MRRGSSPQPDAFDSVRILPELLLAGNEHGLEQFAGDSYRLRHPQQLLPVFELHLRAVPTSP
jgi:hypothetical protein